VWELASTGFAGRHAAAAHANVHFDQDSDRYAPLDGSVKVRSAEAMEPTAVTVAGPGRIP